MARMQLTSIALHLDHHMMDGLVEALTHVDSPVKAVCYLVAAFHMHRHAH